jgi:hypothetical protein
MAITYLRWDEESNVKYRSVLLLCLLPLLANALEVGDRLTSWTLLDQFDQAFTLDNRTQTLLVARSMDGAKLVNAALQGEPKGFLEARHAVFVADIQRMPALIAKMFAVPAMRDYDYRVMLDRDGRVAPRYPGAEDKVLWLQLKDGQLVDRREYAAAAQLREALESSRP